MSDYIFDKLFDSAVGGGGGGDGASESVSRIMLKK